MTSYIISSSDKEKREAYAITLCRDQQIDQFDTTILKLELDEKSKKTTVKQSIGIEEIKQLQQKIFLKPVRSPKKAIIIQDAQFLTTEAQNAMLKILEEPPEQTLIFLTADSSENLLPTIISRCSLIKLEEEMKETLTEDADEIAQFYAELSHFSSASALEYAEKIGKSKAEALNWLEKAIRIIRETQLLKNTSSTVSTVKILKKVQQTHTLLKTTNVNVRMALETTFLSFVS